LRNTAGAPVRIVTHEGDRQVGDVDGARAPEQVHTGASYIHQGQHWRVVELDLDVGVARVTPDDGSTYTIPRRDTQVRLLDVEQARHVGRARLHLGTVEVESSVVGYQRKDALTGAVVESVPLELPRTTLRTRAVWYVVEPDVVAEAGIDAAVLGSALHAVEHAAIGMLPLFAICDRWDVGGVSTALQADTGLPTIVIYDAMPGGSGVAELGYEACERHLPATRESVRGCSCDDGCPSCIQSPKCGNANEHLDKRAALDLLAAILRAR
jgi:DEAD/DEAH box helicase domain-containing protein